VLALLCVCVYVFYGFCFLFKRNEKQGVHGSRVAGWWDCELVMVGPWWRRWWKKKNSDTSSHIVHTFVTRPTFINYNWRFIYLSCQSQEPLDFFFTRSSRLFKVYVDFYVYIIIYTFAHAYNNNERYQKWFFRGIRPRCILFVSSRSKTFNAPPKTTAESPF